MKRFALLSIFIMSLTSLSALTNISIYNHSHREGIANIIYKRHWSSLWKTLTKKINRGGQDCTYLGTPLPTETSICVLGKVKKIIAFGKTRWEKRKGSSAGEWIKIHIDPSIPLP